MRAAPSLSVLMPAYNHERYVGAAIESVLDQTGVDLEFIIIDDGSTDATADVIQSYSDPRIVFSQQANRDASHTLNRGLGMARGECIAIMNSDDVYAPNRLQTMLHAIQEADAACAFTGVIGIDEFGMEISDVSHPWNQWYSGLRAHFDASPTLYHGFLKGNVMVSTSNLFLTRQAAEITGCFAPLRYLHDYDYIFRLLQCFGERTLFLAEQPLLRYRVHRDSTLAQGAVEARLQDRDLIRRSLYARLPLEFHSYLDVGIARLIELSIELIIIDRNSGEKAG